MSDWLIVLEAEFFDKWIQIPRRDQRQVIQKIGLLAKNPLPNGRTQQILKYQDHNVFRLRSGDYRIIYYLQSPYIGIKALIRRDDETYKVTFKPKELSILKGIEKRYKNLDIGKLEECDKRSLISLKDEILNLLSEINTQKDSLNTSWKEIEKTQTKLKSDEKELINLEKALSYSRSESEKSKAALESKKTELRLKKEEIIEKENEMKELESKLSLEKKYLAKEKQRVSRELRFFDDHLEKRRIESIERTKIFISEKLSEIQYQLASILPPPPPSIIVSQKPDEQILLLPRGEEFEINFTLPSDRSIFIYLIVLGGFFILLPWPTSISMIVYGAFSIFMYRHFEIKSRNTKREINSKFGELQRKVSKYKSIRETVLNSYQSQLEISKVTLAGQEDFVRRVAWWRNECFVITLNNISFALKELDALKTNRTDSTEEEHCS